MKLVERKRKKSNVNQSKSMNDNTKTGFKQMDQGGIKGKRS